MTSGRAWLDKQRLCWDSFSSVGIRYMDERQTETIPIYIREASIKPVNESCTFNFIFVIVLEEGDGARFFIGGNSDKETTTLYSHSPCLPGDGLTLRNTSDGVSYWLDSKDPASPDIFSIRVYCGQLQNEETRIREVCKLSWKTLDVGSSPDMKPVLKAPLQIEFIWDGAEMEFSLYYGGIKQSSMEIVRD
ncbi:uncharacterized protein FPRO_10395 [Fusarium proliferatum ET1]|uniref:Uncharacterized protein n=1 Tax=Fusarium proliferatum (strain ET1) TaxID=1227346 RepID=A0A1L7VJQ8_FUSPR|nr:uncharacterized protein FPRO_10395 [Fusarium proliferatum ET1]CZR40807.1 uncharacterized protein FPRO_10395 [Fusarium proliferatum ET1]